MLIKTSLSGLFSNEYIDKVKHSLVGLEIMHEGKIIGQVRQIDKENDTVTLLIYNEYADMLIDDEKCSMEVES